MMEQYFILVATVVGFCIGYAYANFELDKDFISIFEINSGKKWIKVGKHWRIANKQN